MSSMMLHCGTEVATLEEVRAVTTPEPEGRWFPVPYGDLIDAVHTSLDTSGYNIVSEEYGLLRDGDRMFGFMDLENGVAHDDYRLSIAIRNSYDKWFSNGFAVGTHVFCCDNLAFYGDVKFARKNTRWANRDLMRIVAEAMGELGSMRDGLNDRIDAYKNTPLSDPEVHDFVIRAVDAKVIPNAGISKVLKEWRDSEHEEFAPRTAWSLENSFTEVMKGANPVDLTRRSMRLHGLLDLVTSSAGHDPHQVVIDTATSN